MNSLLLLLTLSAEPPFIPKGSVVEMSRSIKYDPTPDGADIGDPEPQIDPVRKARMDRGYDIYTPLDWMVKDSAYLRKLKEARRQWALRHPDIVRRREAAAKTQAQARRVVPTTTTARLVSTRSTPTRTATKVAAPTVVEVNARPAEEVTEVVPRRTTGPVVAP